jgi:hypothetical protein
VYWGDASEVDGHFSFDDVYGDSFDFCFDGIVRADVGVFRRNGRHSGALCVCAVHGALQARWPEIV